MFILDEQEDPNAETECLLHIFKTSNEYFKNVIEGSGKALRQAVEIQGIIDQILESNNSQAMVVNDWKYAK